MKLNLIPIALILASSAHAQKTTSYYDFEWKSTDVSHARFISILERNDSGWHRVDYYVQGPTLEMEGWYEDSACKKGNGQFLYGYPTGKLETTGKYVHGKKQGLWITYHPNGMMEDSIVYENGHPIGTSMHWYPNGFPSDSAVYAADRSGIEVSWFENGNPSAAGYWAAGHKRTGRWKFFHSNGQLASIELYDQGQLTQKQYYDDKGMTQSDTTNRDHPCSFGKDVSTWLAYLQENVTWPSNYKIVNGDVAAVVVSFTIDENGKIKDAYISVPFAPQFNDEAILAISRAPKWHPAVEHNRTVESHFRQPVVFKQPAGY